MVRMVGLKVHEGGRHGLYVDYHQDNGIGGLRSE